jgi:hypothetical protein
MGKEYDNTNRGSIWKNDKKETDNHPDFTGSLNVDGTEYWVSAWKRKPDASDKAPALSFSVKPKDAAPQRGGGGGKPAPSTGPRGGDDPFPDDDIPFITNRARW